MFDYQDLPQLTYWADASILQPGDAFTVAKQFLHSAFGKVFYVNVEYRAKQVGCRVWVSQHPKKNDMYIVELEKKTRTQPDPKSPPRLRK